MWHALDPPLGLSQRKLRVPRGKIVRNYPKKAGLYPGGSPLRERPLRTGAGAGEGPSSQLGVCGFS